VLFVISQLALSYYLSQGSVKSAYETADSLVVLLAWIFYSTQILFLGAEFTEVYADHEGRNIKPDKMAVPEKEVWSEGAQPSP